MSFENAMNFLFDEFNSSKGKLLIQGGRNGYWITGVDLEHAVTITQGSTRQVHLNKYLKELFDFGKFTAPRSGKPFTRKDKFGHLQMKNAIVDYLQAIEKKYSNYKIIV